MPKTLTALEKIEKARQLIRKARRLKPPEGVSPRDISHVAAVKDLLRLARDMVKFLPQTVGVSPEVKAEAKLVLEEIETADKEISLKIATAKKKK